MIAILSFARVLGMVFFCLAGFIAVMALARHELWAAGITGLVAASGLGFTVYIEKLIKLKRASRTDKQILESAIFNENSLKVSFRWLRWIVLTIVSFGLVYLFVILSTEVWHKGKLLPTVLLGFLCLLLMSSLLSLILSAKRAWQSGFALNADPFGLSLAGWPLIGWRDIRGIDLRETEVKGQKQYTLIFALEAALWRSMKQRSVPWPFRGSGPVLRKDSLLEMPCAFLSQSPEFLLQAIQSISDKYGARRLRDWKYFVSIDIALKQEEIREQIQEADRKTAELFEQLKKLNASDLVDEKKLIEIDRQFQVEFEKMSTATTAQLEAFKTVAESRLKMSKRFLWGMYALLFFVIGGAILKIAMALRI